VLELVQTVPMEQVLGLGLMVPKVQVLELAQMPWS